MMNKEFVNSLHGTIYGSLLYVIFLMLSIALAYSLTSDFQGLSRSNQDLQLMKRVHSWIKSMI